MLHIYKHTHTNKRVYTLHRKAKNKKMGNSLRCISQEQDPNQKKPSTVVNGSDSEKHVRRLSLIPSFRRRTLLPSLSCSGSSTSTSSTSKKGGIKTKKKIRERHHQEHHDHHEKDSLIQEQTLAATNILFSQTPRNSNSAPPFRRSTSVVYTQSPAAAVAASVGSVSGVLTPKKATCGFVRSSSNRQRSSTDPVLKPNQLLDKASTFNSLAPTIFSIYQTGQNRTG